MAPQFRIRAGQCSETGAKSVNQDCCGLRVPEEPLASLKGMAAVIADGMSTAEAGREAAEACVQGFLNDYFSTADSWSVKTSAGKVLSALNRWLYGQAQSHHGSATGMVTTLSALVIKSATVHLFHIGDTRIYRLRDGVIEQLTHDHRLVVGGERTYLSRALGIDLHVEIDYSSHPVEEGDVFVLTTDGVHDHLHDQELARLVARGEPDQAARAIVASALARGSPDNLTCQVLSIDGLPLPDQDSFYRRLTDLPFPPPLEAGMVLDGYRILREIHASKRSQVYLALDAETGEEVVLKTPSVNYDDDPEYIQHFLHEEWVGRRLRSPHVVKVLEPRRRRQWLYFAAEYVSGQTLRQWMHDHPTPSLPLVRGIVQQVAAGLRAFHRMEMTHQDLKPENILLDEHGTVKITDFGSTKIAGIEEIASPIEGDQMLGTENYTAPEYLLGGTPGPRSDLFSLAVITYELLTSRLPYGEDLAKRLARGRRGRVQYVAATRYNPEVPEWVDGAIERAVQIEPSRRYAALSELVHDLSHPNPQYLRTATRPLLERNPVGFWRGAAILLLALDLVLVYVLVR